MFGRKQPKLTLSERCDELAMNLTKLIEDDVNKEVTAVLVIASSKNGSSIVAGDALKIHEGLERTAMEDPHFAKVLNAVSRRLMGITPNTAGPIGNKDNEDEIPPHIKKIFDKLGGRNSGIVDLPDGKRGIAIDTRNIDKITDGEIDNIIDDMIKNINLPEGDDEPKD